MGDVDISSTSPLIASDFDDFAENGNAVQDLTRFSL